MPRYRHSLPQLREGLFLTDGGIETTLIFHNGLSLPDFSAFSLLHTAEGEHILHEYYRRYAELARHAGTGLILEAPTWRASTDWGARQGYSAADMDTINHRAIHLLEVIRREYETPDSPMVISGCIGPRGDGYVTGHLMNKEQAHDYHLPQLQSLANSEADMACALTMNYTQEAIGVAAAARRVKLPVAISFTVETDGRLPSGENLMDAIHQVDSATSGYPVYYMINCAHPTHFARVLTSGNAQARRIHGLRANASRLSHAELDAAETLDDGNPVVLGEQMATLRRTLPWLNVLGGCCGTDHRHIEQIARHCLHDELQE